MHSTVTGRLCLGRGLVRAKLESKVINFVQNFLLGLLNGLDNKKIATAPADVWVMGVRLYAWAYQVWVYGCMDVRAYGYMGVWVHGCTGV